MTRPRALPLLALVAGLAASASALPARADMMSACSAEVARFCPQISNGRGRISACLASQMGSLSAPCRTEVNKVMQGRLTPAYVRRALDPSFRAPVPAACSAAAGRYCSGFPGGDARVFACLYSRSDVVGKACNDAATATLRAGG